MPSAEPPAPSIKTRRAFRPLSWPSLAFVLTLPGVLWTAAILNDPDTYWHLAVAEWMHRHAAVPAADPFSFTLRGAPWVAHEWLSEILLGAVHHVFGWAGLVAVTAVTAAAVIGLLARFLVDRMKPVRAIMLLSLTPIALDGHILARPHMFGLLAMTLWTVQLARAAEQGQRPHLMWAALMALWANLHGSFIFGLGMIAVFALDACLTAPDIDRRATLIAWSKFAVASLLAAVLTPFGIHSLTFPFEVADMSISLSLINEWKSPDFHKVQAVELWILVLIAGIGLLPARVSWPRLLLLMALIHLALKHIRHADLLAVVAPIVVAAPFGQALARFDRDLPMRAIDRWFDAMKAPASPLVGLALAVATTAASLALPAVRENLEPRPGITPSAALTAVRAAGIDGKVFNYYDFGGYLIHQGVPVFIDGRADMYGDAFVKRTFDAWTHGTALLPLLDEYQVEWTLLPPGVAAVRILDDTPGWLRLYTDNIAVVHRRVPLPAPDPAH